MSNYNDNTAYDFELFAPKVKEQPARVVEIPENKKAIKANAVSQRRALVKKRLSVVAGIAIVVSLAFFQIYGQLQNAEVTDQIYKAKSEINTLKSEQTRLNVEFENKVSFYNIEAIANERGMKKASSVQIKYINLCSEDFAEVVTGDQTVLEKFAAWF